MLVEPSSIFYIFKWDSNGVVTVDLGLIEHRLNKIKK